MKIAIVTYKSKEEYTSNVPNEDKLLYEYLIAKGLDITFEIWDDAGVEWSKYDVAIVKSPWDYFNKIDAFYTWLDKMKALNIPLLNNVDIIKWNADKHYLQDIADKGLPVIPTIWLEKNTPVDFDPLFAQLNTDNIIIKPCVSGAAKNTYSIGKANYTAHTSIINAHLQEESYMAQPFMSDITEKGEWSFIFFGGKYSHCVLKTAKEGDFRVQHFLGGTIHTPTAPPHLLKDATKIIDTFAKDCLYARVDGVESQGQLYLMELELIEPLLFMFTNNNAFENYFVALRQMIGLK